MNTENTTLEIRKVPHSMNNIAKMNEHFSQFGTIVNLQVRKGEMCGGRGDMRGEGGGRYMGCSRSRSLSGPWPVQFNYVLVFVILFICHMYTLYI